MHLRKLTLTVGLFGALFSTWAFGLGLGEVTLKSTLNQPLDAEIKLLQVRNLNKEEILVELAPAADFERFGIERLFFLQNLKFDVQLDHPNGPMVRIWSDEPVREPYLVFLIQAQSPSSGRLLREYTLLMDLPVFADEPSAPIQAPARQPAAQPAPAIRPQPSTPAESRPAQRELVQREGEPPRAQPAPGRSASAPSTVAADGYRSVQANDTLWEIASEVRPNGVSMQQSMLAIQRANPDAFINGNINLLKRGQVLRIPENDEWQVVDQQTAVRQVAQQNNEWKQGRTAVDSGAELAASSSRPSRPRSTDAPRGQLTLSAPGTADRADEVSGAGSTGARGEALENELAIASEELDAARRENRELNSRIVELEEQISTMERLLDVSSAELRALQLAAEQNLAEESEVADESRLTADELEAETVAEEAPVADELPAAEEQAEASEVKAASPAPVAQPINTVVPRQPQPSLLDKVMAQIWYLVAGIFAIIAGVGYFLFRRRQADEWESFDDDDLFGMEADGDASPEFLEEGNELDAGLSADPSFDEFAETDSDFDTDEPVQAETGDVVAEADIYIAYGKLEQAEEMLRRALADDPSNVDARLKLMEVFVESNDVASFDVEYQALLNAGDAGASSRAAELRSGIADAPPFVGDINAGLTAQDAAEDSFEHSVEAEGNRPDVELAGAGTLADPSFGELNFDLGELDESSGGSTDADSLELSFDLGEEEEASEEAGFDFNLDSAVEAEANDGSGDFLGDIEFTLDDELELGSGNDSTSTGSEAGSPSDDLSFDLDLDLDLGSTSADSTNEKSLDFSLEEDELEASELEGAEDEFSLDGEALTLDVPDLEFETPQPEAETTAAGDELLKAAQQPEAQEEDMFSLDADDGFDMELGDLDLEALDQEMDALVGAVDDEDVAMADPLTLREEDSAPEAEAAVSTTDEPETLGIDLKLDGLSAEQAAELERDNPFGADQDFDPDDLEDEFDFLADSDEVATKLDLARAYIDMGDQDGARDILDEVSTEGSDEQKREAQELLEKMV